MFWVWCLCFFTGNMNLVVLLTSVLLGNSTNKIQINPESSESIQDYSEKSSPFRNQWEQYKVEFSKEYASNAEELRRMEIFMENAKMIEEHNLLYDKGHFTYALGHNQFSDLSHQEYLDLPIDSEAQEGHDEVPLEYRDEAQEYYDSVPTLKNYIEPTLKSENRPAIKNDFVEGSNIEKNYEYLFIPPEDIDVSHMVDWRARGAVTPVKNEGHCGASWAFSATGALEGQLFLRTHNLTSLSEQNLVDCSTKYGNKGCKNGTALDAYRYILENGGIDTNTSYPWSGKHSWFCHYKRNRYNPAIHGVAHILSRNETALQSAVSSVGPVAVAIDARSRKFRFYRKGIFREASCSSSVLTREMLVVGYGRSFWILKNSWGARWGASGYIYMNKDGRNHCGVATRAVYPIV